MTSTTELLNGIPNEVLNQVDLTGGLSLETAPALLYVALHTNYPGGPGSPQTTNEMPTANWANYSRKSLVRSAGAGGFTVDPADFAYNFDNISFNQRTESSTSPVATHISLGTRSTGSGAILWSSPLVDANANWLYCIADGNGDFITADYILVSSGHAGTVTIPTGASTDTYEVAPLYADTLPTPLSQSTRYWIKSGTITGTSPRLWKLQLATVSETGTAVPFSNTSGVYAFQMIKSSPLTIIQNAIPTINAGSFRATFSAV